MIEILKTEITWVINKRFVFISKKKKKNFSNPNWLIAWEIQFIDKVNVHELNENQFTHALFGVGVAGLLYTAND